MTNLSVKLGRITMANPVTVASGTFGLEHAQLYDLNRLGALVSKTITPAPRAGNTPPRLYETSNGLLNSIGLQNPGVDAFIQNLPAWQEYTPPLLVSVSAGSIDEFCQIVEQLEPHPAVAGYEINVSCPNVKNEGLAFGTDPDVVFTLTQKLAKITTKELLVKLSPNVTDIVTIAKAAQAAGATSLGLINTLLGMAINWQNGKSYIARGIAGYSGPAIKPVAVRMIWQVAKAVDIPILGMGGVSTWQDALEFIWAGATAVAVGTASFYQPKSALQIIDGLHTYFDQNRLSPADIRGQVTGLHQ